MPKQTCPTCQKEFVHITAHLNKKNKCVAPSGLTTPSLADTVTTLTNRINNLENLVANLAIGSTATTTTTQTEKNAISLFSGAGGDTLGLERAGFKVIAFNEFNEAASQTHKKAFPSSTLIVDPATKKTDIKKVPDSEFEKFKGRVQLIFAGFPCQGFSHAGRKRSNDKRNELVHEFARAAKIIQPEWIIGENVKGLLSRKGKDPYQLQDAPLRPVIDIIKDLFERVGYKITYKVIDVTEIGVPQRRKRLIIVGHRGTEYPHMPWNNLEPANTAPQTSIRGFLEGHLENAIELPAIYRPSEQPTNYWIATTETTPTGAPHPNLDRLVRGIRNSSSKEKAENANVPNQIIEPNGLISFGVRKGGYYGMIVNPDVACNTIICTYNLCPRLFVGLYNQQTQKYWIRCMTPRELGQIQGFPKDYEWQGTEKEQIIQIGNAVPPPLVERVARSLDKVEFKNIPQLPGDTADEESDEDADEE